MAFPACLHMENVIFTNKLLYFGAKLHDIPQNWHQTWRELWAFIEFTVNEKKNNFHDFSRLEVVPSFTFLRNACYKAVLDVTCTCICTFCQIWHTDCFPPYLGINGGAEEFFFGRQQFFAMLSLSALCYDFFSLFMDLYGHCLRTITSVDVRNSTGGCACRYSKLWTLYLLVSYS